MILGTTSTDFIFSVLLAAAILYLRCEGGAICYDCDSKANNNCTPESLSVAIKGSCPRDKDYCAAYKKEPPGNVSAHQYVRYCASECLRFNTTYTTGSFQKTKHCILCCKGDLCNNYNIDPCNPPSTGGRLELNGLTITLLGVMAVFLCHFL